MKAAVCAQYGSPDVLQCKDMKKPIPGDREVLVKVHASSVTAADGMMRKGDPYLARFATGLMRPKNPIPGTGFAGEIEAVGKAVTLFKVNERVFGESGLGFGANAEYLCVAEDGVISNLPSQLTFEEACPVCDGALTAFNFLKNLSNVQRGQRVLINGASGSIGSSAVQLANHFGAEVTGVCSAANTQLVRSLGANKVIDYTKQDFTKTGDTYDIIFDTLGKRTYLQCKNALTEHGTYLSPVLSLPLLLQMLWTSIIGNKKALFSATGLKPAPELRTALNELKILLEAKKLVSIIDKRYPLEQLAQAHHYVETERKRGNVVITS